MSLKYFTSGFFVKTIEGFDDSMIRIPICANITKTKLKIFEKVLESLDVNEIIDKSMKELECFDVK